MSYKYKQSLNTSKRQLSSLEALSPRNFIYLCIYIIIHTYIQLYIYMIIQTYHIQKYTLIHKYFILTRKKTKTKSSHVRVKHYTSLSLELFFLLILLFGYRQVLQIVSQLQLIFHLRSCIEDFITMKYCSLSNNVNYISFQLHWFFKQALWLPVWGFYWIPL